MIDHEYLELFNQSSIRKDIDITYDTDSHITNSDVVSGSFNLNESAFATKELRFGSLVSSQLSVKLYNTVPNLMDKELDVSIVVNNATSNPLKIGKYKVLEDKPTTDRLYKQIKAYDGLYEVINKNVVDWYEGLSFPLTQKAFRDSFFNYIGITQVDITLVNDDMLIEKTITANTISGQQVLSAICELNGAIGRMNRDGNFEYVILEVNPSNRITIDKIVSKSGSYEDFDCQPISKVQIKQTADDIGAIVGTNGNTYIVQDNFLAYGKSSTDLTTTATNLLSVIKGITYTPFNIKAIYGNPCYEIGDAITVVTKNKTFNSYIFNRTLKGIQAMSDTIKADGVEYYTENLNSANVQVQQLKRQTNELSRTVEETKSTITSVETIANNATDLANEANKNANQALDNIDISATAEGNPITVTDSGNQSLIEFKEDGYIQQNTLSGKNKLPSSGLVKETENGITFTPVYEDGLLQYINVNGTATATATYGGTPVIENGTYLLYGFEDGSSSTYGISVRTKKDGSNVWYNSYKGGEQTIPISDTNTFGSWYIQVASGATVSNVKCYPMLKLQGDGDRTYEPYCGGTASPNPDYPQDIQGLGDDGNIEVKTTGKNLCPLGSTTSTRYINIPINYLMDGENYILSCSVTSTDTDKTSCAIYRVTTKSEKYLGDFSRDTRVSIKFMKNIDDTHIRIYASNSWANSANDTIAVSDIQIEEGTKTTDYEPYQGSSAIIPIDTPLYEGDYIEYFADGTGQIVRKYKKLVLDGSSDETWGNSTFSQPSDSSLVVYGILNTSAIPQDTNPSWCNITTWNTTRNILNTHQMRNSGSIAFTLSAEKFPTLASFKTWLQSNPITVVYELAEPTVIPLIAEQLEEIEKLYTFESTTNVFAESNTYIQYYKNNQNADVVAKGNQNVLAKAQSSITQTADEIKLEVSKTYSTKTELDSSIKNLQDQIDGALGSYSGSEVPTRDNYPANEWTTTALKDAAIGSLYFVNSEGGEYAGFSYRWEKLSDGTYQWALLKDTEVTQALKELEDLKKNLANNYSTTVEMNSAIDQKAESITTSVSKTYATKAETSEAQTTANSALSKADSYATDITALTTRVSKAESSITQNAEEIELKVSNDEIISTINQSAEEVKIQADKIKLEGYTSLNNGLEVLEDGSVLIRQGRLEINTPDDTTSSIYLNYVDKQGDETVMALYSNYIQFERYNADGTSESSSLSSAFFDLDFRTESGNVNAIKLDSEHMEFNGTVYALDSSGNVLSETEYWQLDKSGISTAGYVKASGELQSTTANGLRLVQGNYGFFIRNDGTHIWFMLTNSGNQYGTYNSLRPLHINASTGAVNMDNGLTVSGGITSNANLTVKGTTNVARLDSSSTIHINGISYLNGGVQVNANGTAIKLIKCGTTVLNLSGTSVELLSLATIQGWYSGATATNTAILVSNGDASANGTHIESASFQNNKWYVVVNGDTKKTGNLRVNYTVICW